LGLLPPFELDVQSMLRLTQSAQGVDTNHFPRFRRPTGDVVRPVDEIALPELAALAREVQEEGYEGYVALSAMAKLAGLQKLRQSSRQRFVGATSFNI